jgi:hypothetical protein
MMMGAMTATRGADQVSRKTALCQADLDQSGEPG